MIRPPRPDSLPRRALLAAALLPLLGCAGYQVGARSLYRADIRTVYVPVFESDSLRRNLGERLTEAVIKEIERKTPYKVVSHPGADSMLTGRIISERRRVTAENAFDEPRAYDLDFVVQVSWVDRRGDLLSGSSVPLPAQVVSIGETGFLIPEAGQSLATAQQEVIVRTAVQIVSKLEFPW